MRQQIVQNKDSGDATACSKKCPLHSCFQNSVESMWFAGCRFLHGNKKWQLKAYCSYFFYYYLICVFQKLFWKALCCPCIQGQEGLAAMKKCESHTNNAILCLLFTTSCASEMRLGSISCLQRVTHISHTVLGCWKHWGSSFRNDLCPHPIGALTDVTNAWAQGGLRCLQPFLRQLFYFVL